jgi:XTP/dITP diphosphohydrolase
VLLATRSAGKLRELRPLLSGYGMESVGLIEIGLLETEEEDGIESFETFEENALAKARYFFDRSGLPTMADDSGLVVRALGGQPGVHSKRWSGRNDLAGHDLDDENNRLLLESLVGARDRGAAYVCAAAYVDSAREVVTRGEVIGEITHEARGSSGFGYDPYFLSTELGVTFGEASLREKQEISHRGRAFRLLLDRL